MTLAKARLARAAALNTLLSVQLSARLAGCGTLVPVDDALQRAALETLLSVARLAASVIETRIAVTGNRPGDPRLAACCAAIGQLVCLTGVQPREYDQRLRHRRGGLVGTGHAPLLTAAHAAQAQRGRNNMLGLRKS